ncbi:ROK family transcriptional regulator [Humibacter soli]
MTASAADDAWSWPALHEGQRAVLLEVLFHGSRSRAELARRVGLSRTSLTRLTRDLVELGFVREGEILMPSGRGRPPEMLELLPDAAHFAGIKLTGDALYAAVVDLRATTIHTEEHPLQSRDVDAVVDLIASTVNGLRARFSRLTAVGVCLAGDVHEVDGAAVVEGSWFLGWESVPLASLVSSATGLPTSVANDVQALTAAHHWFGAGVGCSSLALIGLGAGIGAGIVVGDELVTGANGHPGKVSHIPVVDTGPRCDRGHVGCASSFVTMPAIVRNAKVESGGYDEVVRRAHAGDEEAVAAFRAAGTALGVVIAQIVNLIDPQKVIVTGEGLGIFDFARAAVDEAIAARLDPSDAPIAVEVQAFRFADYAWAAAVGTIRALI